MTLKNDPRQGHDSTRIADGTVTFNPHLQQDRHMEMIGRLAGGIAYDFNNRLQTILGKAEQGLEDLPPDSRRRETLEDIREAAERAALLTRQLLAFSRQQTIKPSLLNLNETVESMITLIQRIIGEDIRIHWQPELTLKTVNMDPLQINQILANLCVNARDNLAHVGTVTVKTENRTFANGLDAAHTGIPPGDYVSLAVSDNGRGIDPETLPHIFEPFFTSACEGKNTGLNLASVYGIVKQNHGFITVTSNPEQGTTFTLFLPCSDSTPAESVVTSLSTLHFGNNKTVLLVEDEKSIGLILRRNLEKLGYSVLTAESPVEALRQAKDHPEIIHLLLTDVVMPKMNGRQLAEQVRALHPAIQCVFMSGFAANILAPHGVLEDGMQFLQKPFSRDELSLALQAVMNPHLPASKPV